MNKEFHYELRAPHKSTLEYVTELQLDAAGVWIAHFLRAGGNYYPIQFDPDRFMTQRDFKWLAAYYWRLGIVMKPMKDQDYIHNGQTSLIASTVGIKE